MEKDVKSQGIHPSVVCLKRKKTFGMPLKTQYNEAVWIYFRHFYKDGGGGGGGYFCDSIIAFLDGKIFPKRSFSLMKKILRGSIYAPLRVDNENKLLPKVFAKSKMTKSLVCKFFSQPSTLQGEESCKSSRHTMLNQY